MSSAAGPPYQVSLRSRRVQRELDALSRVDYRRVIAAIRGLSADPRPDGAAQLEDEIFRIRVGRFRIIFRIDYAERTVEIGGIRRRNEQTYRGVRDMF